MIKGFIKFNLGSKAIKKANFNYLLADSPFINVKTHLKLLLDNKKRALLTFSASWCRLG